jgi:PIN domain nuclease of toxin-antitoxin system
MASLILDTNAFILAAIGGKMKATAEQAIYNAALAEELFLSPVNAWEIGLLANLQTGRSLGFADSPLAFFQSALNRDGWTLLPLTIEAAILSSRLPGDFHKDPADRLLVASAMAARATFVTRDSKILDWAARTGALVVLEC